MPSKHGHADRGALFFALGAGATCFLLSLTSLIVLGFATGYEHLEIPFTLPSRPHLTWWEIVSFLASLWLSVSTAEFVYRRCKKYIHQGIPRL
jgi:hypothetical protein